MAVACLAPAAHCGEEAASVALRNLDLSKATDAELFEASSACRTLTRIGTERSVVLLEKLLDDPRTRDYARTALRNIDGEKAEAALKRHPARKDNASPVDEKKRALLSTALPAILKGDQAGLARFVTLLKSDDPVEFKVALEALRRFPDRRLVDLLAIEQRSLTPQRRVAAILALPEIDFGQVPQPLVTVAAQDLDPEARAAALTVLGRGADAETVPLLFSALGAENDTVAKAAFEALATTKSPVEKLIVQNLNNDNPDIRKAACRLVGERRIVSAEEALWNAIPLRSCKDYYPVLGRIADAGGFEKLLDHFDKLADVGSKKAAETGVVLACQLSGDREKYLEILDRNRKDRPETVQVEFLSALGGRAALQEIVSITKTTGRDDVRDRATRILGQWTGGEVAPALLDLSSSLREEKYKIRTLRGFLRAVSRFDMTKEEKRNLCEKALVIATRDEEREKIGELLVELK